MTESGEAQPPPALDLARQKLAAEVAYLKARTGELSRSWYKSPGFWFALTAAAAAVISSSVAIVQALSQQEITRIEVKRSMLRAESAELRAEKAEESLRNLEVTGSANRRRRYETQTVIVGGKDFPEGYILCELLALLIEDSDSDVEVVRTYRGSTNANYAQLRLGMIDMYVEYTGTCARELLRLPAQAGATWTPTQLNDLMSKHKVEGLNFAFSLGFKNPYVFVTKHRDANPDPPKTIRGFVERWKAKRRTPVLAASSEFCNRQGDGLRALERHYGFDFGEPKRIVEEEMYKQFEKGADVVVGFWTDHQVSDDSTYAVIEGKGFFPTYEAALLVHEEFTATFPEITRTLNTLAGEVTYEDVRGWGKEAKDAKLDKNTSASELKEKLGPFLRKWLKGKSLVNSK